MSAYEEKETKKIFEIGDILTGEEAHFAYFERRIPPGAVILYVKDGEALSVRPLDRFSDELIQSKDYFFVARDMRLGRRNLAP